MLMSLRSISLPTGWLPMLMIPRVFSTPGFRIFFFSFFAWFRAGVCCERTRVLGMVRRLPVYSYELLASTYSWPIGVLDTYMIVR